MTPSGRKLCILFGGLFSFFGGIFVMAMVAAVYNHATYDVGMTALSVLFGVAGICCCAAAIGSDA